METEGAAGEPRVMVVDQEHLGLRLMVPLLTVFACVGTYWIGLQLTAGGSAALMVLVVLPLAIGAGLGAAWLAERVLKRLWPSRRSLKVDETGLTLSKQAQTESTLNWRQHINVLAWRFTVPPRRGRIPKGWYCMACRLVQDEQAMTFYAFFPPDEAKALAHYDRFATLVSRKAWEKATPAERLAMGDQARLHSAEMERWERGAELAREDFAALVRVMGARIAGLADAKSDAGAALAVESEGKPERPPSKGEGKPIQL